METEPAAVRSTTSARFAALLRASPDAMVCVGHDGTIQAANPQVTRTFGYSQVELIGSELEMLLPGQLGEPDTAVRADLHRDPHVGTAWAGVSLAGRRRDGSRFPVEINLAADTSDSDTIVIVAIRDMTEQRALEQRSRENETRLTQLAASADTLFVLCQLDPPACLYASPSSRTVLGLDPEELLAHPDPVAMTVHPDDRERLAAARRQADRRGGSAESEHRVVWPDGQVRWVRLFWTHVPNPHGPPERWVATIQDITARIDATTAALEAARVIEEAQHRVRQQLAIADERDRISRHLHDGVIQDIFGVSLSLTALRTTLNAHQQAGIDRVIEELRTASLGIRTTVQGLSVLDPHRPVSVAIRTTVDSFTKPLGFPPMISMLGNLEAMPAGTLAELITALNETLSDVTRHADTTSVEIAIVHSDGALTLTVTDDGVAPPSEARTTAPSALTDSAHRLGGRCRTATDAGGRTINWSVPMLLDLPDRSPHLRPRG